MKIFYSGLLVYGSLATATSEGIVFLEGAPLVGGTNGMAFDSSNALWVCQVLGQAISRLDPESGEILETFRGALFPDDLTFDNNNTMYWTDPLQGAMFKYQNGEIVPLFPPGTYPNANPLVLSEDYSRLYFGQCFEPPEVSLGVFELDLATGNVSTIVDGIPLCSSNSMDILNNTLYTPRVFEGRVVKIDLNTKQVSDAVTGLVAPNAAKFDSQGNLHVVDSGVGQVYRINMTDGSRVVVANALLANPPFQAIDNLIFDDNDRLYISSVIRGTVLEVLGVDEFRTVSPGLFNIASGIALLNDTLHVVNPLGLYGYNAESGEEIYAFGGIPGASGMENPTNLAALYPNKLILLSLVANSVMLWDTKEQGPLAAFRADSGLAGPVDALVLSSGILVTNAITGMIFNISHDFSEIQEFITLPGALYLAGNETDVYCSSYTLGTVSKVTENGQVLSTPIDFSHVFATPEGITLTPDGKSILVVATGTGTLEQLDLTTGEVAVLARNLEFAPPIPNVSPFGWANKVQVLGNNAFVNGESKIYKISLLADDGGGDSSGIRGFHWIQVILPLASLFALALL